jgi:hypothetical protein
MSKKGASLLGAAAVAGLCLAAFPDPVTARAAAIAALCLVLWLTEAVPAFVPTLILLVATPLALDDIAAIAASLVNGLGQGLLSPGSEVLERELLQLPVGLVEPQPVSNRRVDVQGFFGDELLLFWAHAFQRLHVMQSIGQFH